MKCPRCVQPIHRAAAACPHCAFSIDDADQLFGGEELKLRALTDAAGIFRHFQREVLAASMDRISSAFPQVFISIHTKSLGDAGNLRQFGFWLLNRGVFEDVPAEKPKEAGLLIVIDPDTRSAAISYGYLLEPFLDEKDTFDCLSRAHSHWLDGRYADGTLRCLQFLEKLLRRRSRQARRDPEKFRRLLGKRVAVEGSAKRSRRSAPGRKQSSHRGKVER